LLLLTTFPFLSTKRFFCGTSSAKLSHTITPLLLEQRIIDEVQLLYSTLKVNQPLFIRGSWIRHRYLDPKAKATSLTFYSQDPFLVEQVFQLLQYRKSKDVERVRATKQEREDGIEEMKLWLNGLLLKFQRGEDLQQTALREEFTIDTLYYNIRTSTLEDPTGKGLEDLQNRLLRLTRPVDSSEIDPMTLLRAVFLSSNYNLRVDAPLDKLLHNPTTIEKLAEADQARAQEVLHAILQTRHPAKSLVALLELNMHKPILRFDLAWPQTHWTSHVTRQATNTLKNLSYSLGRPKEDSPHRRSLYLLGLLLPTVGTDLHRLYLATANPSPLLKHWQLSLTISETQGRKMYSLLQALHLLLGALREEDPPASHRPTPHDTTNKNNVEEKPQNRKPKPNQNEKLNQKPNTKQTGQARYQGKLQLAQAIPEDEYDPAEQDYWKQHWGEDTQPVSSLPSVVPLDSSEHPPSPSPSQLSPLQSQSLLQSPAQAPSKDHRGKNVYRSSVLVPAWHHGKSAPNREQLRQTYRAFIQKRRQELIHLIHSHSDHWERVPTLLQALARPLRLHFDPELFIEEVKAAKLTGILEIQPILDGKTIMEVLGLQRGGLVVGQIKNALVLWQFEKARTLDEAKAFVKDFAKLHPQLIAT
jgi:tRNA nucleotidyltransferase/poly(A) polymerase